MVMNDFQPAINPVPLPLGPGMAKFVELCAAKGRDPKELEKAAKDFESVLLHKLMEEMARTVPESDMLNSGVSKQIQSIFWFYLAQEVADGGGLGLWRDIRRYAASPSQTDPPAPTVEQDR